MEITSSTEGTKATLALNGKLTVQTSPDLSDAVDALPNDVSEIVIDLSEVTYVASAGLRVLVATDKLAVVRGGSMTLLHPCEDVMEVFEMTGLVDVFSIEQ